MGSRIFICYKSTPLFSVKINRFTSVGREVYKHLKLKAVQLGRRENQEIVRENQEILQENYLTALYPFILKENGKYFIDEENLTFQFEKGEKAMERLTINFDGNYVPKRMCTINRFGEADDCDNCPGNDGNCEGDCNCCPVQECFNKLAEYENTGLSPAEIIDMKKRYAEKCEEAERYRKLSLSPTEMAKMIVILDTFKKLKHGEMGQPECEELQPRTEPVKSEDKDYYLRMLTYARKMLVEICAGEVEEETGTVMEEHLSRMKKQEENDKSALTLCKENEIPNALSREEIACVRKMIGEIKREDVEEELNLLEEFLLAEQKKARREDLPEAEKKMAEERVDRLIKVMKIVNAEKHALTNDDRENLALIVERLLEDTASAHVSEDADDKIEVMVYDSIYRKPLATLEIKKVCDCLDFESFHFYE